MKVHSLYRRIPGGAASSEKLCLSCLARVGCRTSGSGGLRGNWAGGWAEFDLEYGLEPSSCCKLPGPTGSYAKEWWLQGYFMR